jgi:outer membrane murein-binding lipoprotein Lpp
MTVYHRFPYTNFHELNLDWLLQITKHLEEWCSQFDPDLIKNDIQEIINEMVEDGSFDEFFAEWITPLTDDIATLNTQVATLETTVNGLSATVTDLTPRVQTLESHMTAAEENITDLAAGQATMGNRLTAAEGAITTLQGDVGTLQSATGALQSDVETLSDNFDTFRTNTNATLSDHETRITALENAEPPVPSFYNRNMTYRGQRYGGTVSTLLSAIEAGQTYIGDHWTGQLEFAEGQRALHYIYVAKHFKTDGAYLIVVPANITLSRGAIDYTASTIRGTVDTYVDYINNNSMSGKLTPFAIVDNSGVATSVLGSLISAVQYFGYPAFDPTSAGVYINGELPFIRDYLHKQTPIMFMDANADYYAYADTDSTFAIDGVLRYSNTTNTAMTYPYIVKYNG